MAAVPSAGLTQWSRFDVPGMWSLLRNVSTVEAFQQAGAWQSTYEAAQSLARRLQWYRDGLAGKWSPDRSEAAALYLGRLDELIGSAQQLADVSVANRQALVTLANAVDEARPKLQRVYEESQALRRVEAQPKAEASAALRQRQLHKQATGIMESLGDAAMDSWRHYATADDYQPPQSTRGEDVPVNGRNSVVIGSSSIESSRNAARGRTPARPSWAVNYSPEHESLDRSNRSVLAPLPEAVSLAGSSTPISLNLVSEADKAPTVPRLGIDALPPEPGLGTMSTFSFARDAKLPVNEGVGMPEDPIRTAPWVPQQPSAVGRQAVGDPDGTTTRRGQLVNRVGGVIGSDGATVGMAGGLGADVATHRAQRRRRREYDVDDPWHVAEGGLPVLHPLPEPMSFDPGPGVIGIDR